MRLGQHFGRKLGLERRDVWDMLWSEDDEEMLCIVEKTKMVCRLESVLLCICFFFWCTFLCIPVCECLLITFQSGECLFVCFAPLILLVQHHPS